MFCWTDIEHASLRSL